MLMTEGSLMRSLLRAVIIAVRSTALIDITDAGIEYCSALNSVYADSYCQLAYMVIEQYAYITDTELVRQIWSKASSERREEP